MAVRRARRPVCTRRLAVTLRTSLAGVAAILPRGPWPQRPLLRIVLLAAVAAAAVLLAALVFAGPPTDAEPARVAAATAEQTAAGAAAGAPQAAPPGSQTAPSGFAPSEPAAPAAAAEPPEIANGSEPSAPSAVASAAEPSGPPTDALTAAPTPPATPDASDASTPPTADAAPSASVAAPEPAGPVQAVAEPTAPAPPPAARASGSSADPGGVNELIEQLRPLIAGPRAGIPAYDRDYFAGWLDSDGDCVNTRHEVLQLEAAAFAMAQSGCSVASGEWFDPYTARTYINPRDLDVDHVVALADAWVSGAYAWADELLDRFSNDLGNLNAIAAGENRSKSARGPADYTPSAPGARCAYLVQYATVKIRWQLSITPADFAATERGLAGCDAGIGQVSPVVPPAAPRPAGSGTPTTTVATPTGCHPAYSPCLPNLPGNALNCGDLSRDQKPVTVLVPGEDPYRLDGDGDGRGCTS